PAGAAVLFAERDVEREIALPKLLAGDERAKVRGARRVVFPLARAEVRERRLERLHLERAHALVVDARQRAQGLTLAYAFFAERPCDVARVEIRNRFDGCVNRIETEAGTRAVRRRFAAGELVGRQQL